MARAPRFQTALDDLSSVTGKVVVLHPADTIGLDVFDPAGSLCVQPHKPVRDVLVDAGWTVAPVLDGTACDLAVVFVTRSKVQTLALVAAALSSLAPGGRLVVDGAKTDGIESLLKDLSRSLEIGGRTSRDHGKVFWLTRPADLPDQVAVWAASGATSTNADGFATAPGMFSHDAIDPATRLLSEHLPVTLKGAAADLGAGWGALSHAVLSRSEAITALTMIEADWSSLEACKTNVTDPRAEALWADVTALPVPDKSFDVVVSNPPFHQSRKADIGLGQAFIRTAGRILRPKGQFLMVANRQLAYEASLTESFRHWDQVALTNSFKVFVATGAKG